MICLQDVNAIIAEYGTIDANSVTVTSWDPAAPTGPGHSVSTPPGQTYNKTVPGPGIRNRVLLSGAYKTCNNQAGQSVMNIENSTFEYLGYYGPDSLRGHVDDRVCVTPTCCRLQPT